MTRRALLDFARLALLRFRVQMARPLPVALMAALRALDRLAAERALDTPWTRETSARLDRILAAEEREP